MSENRIPKRSEQKKEYTWAIEDIYATDDLWKEDFEKLRTMPEKITAFKGRFNISVFIAALYLAITALMKR